MTARVNSVRTASLLGLSRFGAVVVGVLSLGAALVVPNALWPDADAPDGLGGGVSRAASAFCDVAPFGRVASIESTAAPDELSVRCTYTALGRPVLTGSIYCLNGRWTTESPREGFAAGGCE
jgi:hypothetical protein